MRRLAGAGVLLAAIAVLAQAPGTAQAPGAALGQPPGMPAGTDFGYGTRERPRQILRVEAAGGTQSYTVALGNTAFSAPSLLGERARAAGLSCNTCHVQGETNRTFFIPGVSARPGGLDPTTAFFHARAEDGVANHIDIPSLRGIRHTAPYGRDGRFATLRAFARHVIVDEFAGPEPAPAILDALVAYMEELEFLPNPGIDSQGRPTAAVDDAARRGAALFAKPFAGLGGRACASCHVPALRFTDGQRHDMSGGIEKAYDTPSLLNAAFTAPYWHDGRFADFDAAVLHYDRSFGLGLDANERADLVAWLRALGDGEDPTEPMTRQTEMSELAAYVAVLDAAIAQGDRAAVALVVDTVNASLAQLGRRFDDHRAGGRRRPDRPDVARLATALIEDMTALGTAVSRDDREAALAALQTYRMRAKQLVASYPQGG
jgi:cytochrome c peroxidase